MRDLAQSVARRSPAPTQSYRQVIVLAGVLSAFLVATVIYSARIWGEMGDTAMSSSGYVALALGVVAATAVGTVLMGLVFYSSRKGFDDGIAAERSTPTTENPDRPMA